MEFCVRTSMTDGFAFPEKISFKLEYQTLVPLHLATLPYDKKHTRRKDKNSQSFFLFGHENIN